MKMKKLVTTAAILTAISLVAPSTFAITAAQKKEVRKAVTSVAIPEMPAKAAELVLKATKADRSQVAAEVVRAAIYKSRSSAPQIVAAVAKAAPEVAGIASMTAVQMEGDQATLIARAATTAAPSARQDIASSVRTGLQTSTTVASNPTRFSNSSFSGDSGAVTTRGSAGGVPTGTVINNNKPINQTNGGDGTGEFPTEDPATTGSGTIIDYTKPRPL